MTSSHHAPYVLGYTRTTMGWTEGSEAARWSKPQKPSSVRIAGCNRLHEVGIASNRRSAYCGEYVPGLVHTARHTTKVIHTQSRWVTARSQPSKVGAMIGVKS